MTPVDDLAAPETRDVTVGSSVQRHQLKQYLDALPVVWEDTTDPLAPGRFAFTFRINASVEQWEGINQWLQRTKVN